MGDPIWGKVLSYPNRTIARTFWDGESMRLNFFKKLAKLQKTFHIWCNFTYFSQKIWVEATLPSISMSATALPKWDLWSIFGPEIYILSISVDLSIRFFWNWAWRHAFKCVKWRFGILKKIHIMAKMGGNKSFFEPKGKYLRKIFVMAKMEYIGHFWTQNQLFWSYFKIFSLGFSKSVVPNDRH